MQAKVLVGYQGWFRCPGDGSSRNSWSHWSRGVPSPETLSIDLYPDVNELGGRSLCALPNMAIGMKQAYVFSSFARETVEVNAWWDTETVEMVIADDGPRKIQPDDDDE